MAGESPDRSKQRESSAEPTSGSAVPVPEPEGPSREDAGERRDPRLAVAREATAPRGGVDTATRVLSRQELDAVKTRLEEAGGTAEDAEGGDATADSTEGGDATADDAKSEDATADSTESTDTPADDAEGTDATADDAKSEAATADSTEGTDTSADDAEGTDATADDAGGEDATADGAEGTDTPADSTEGTDATADSTEGTDATADDPREAGSVAGDQEAETESSTATGTVSDGAEDAEAAAGNAEGADAENAKAEADDAGSAEDSSEGADAADADGKAEDAVDEADSGTPAEGDDRLRAAVAAWVASSDADEAEGEAEAASQGETAADADGSAEDAGSDDSREAAEGNTPDDTDTDTDDAPAAADGEDTPQGPPAVGDESRTGGAGGSTKGEGEAEDALAPKAKPVDQPTAVFKTVRPAKQPPVDQPTTTLKAPAPETPSERTSKFVALKPDIKPDAPKPPAAPPAPAPARTSETPKAPAADATAVVPQIGPERTTQQPLPPRPPLDLLAELTNTPPPPDTPVRTAIRRVKIWTPLVLLLAIVFAVVQNVRPLPAPTLDLTAKDSYTFEGGKVDIPWPAEGQAALDVDGIGSFGSSGEQKPVPIASVAKVMTAYLILRDHPLESGDEGPKIKIDQAAEDQSDAGQESTVKVTAGDQITQREALESILIASANNVARLLARWDAGSEKAFVEKMNAAAEGLGMTNTTYTDPSGLNNTTVSTAVDQVKLAKAAMKYPAFREVAAMMSYDDYKGENHGNWNQLVGRNNVVGIKTGTTTSALGNLVFAAKKEIGGETRTVIGAVVRQPDAGSGILAAALDSGDQLIRAAQDTLESATILKKGDVVGYVDDGLGGRTPVVATKDVKAVGWSGLKVKLTFAPDKVPHTATAGTKVGTLTVGDGSSGAVKIPVALQSDLTEPGFTDKLTRIT
ncbi:D-alanyl-D-alanine carboxypeptidase [Streptomyces sp. NBC_01017]|uniref:D-alanyl-D-alanine carboxypeptidase n=1 Tax=Streptomyces sp. NBC_01017 TaxID=2903721 RepID=UPI00386ED546|nr:D-alanyl-D-alanine carboxypeptidase [Streptomyces sp. NBC_01017]